MGWFSDDSDQAQAYNEVRCLCLMYISTVTLTLVQVQNAPHEAKFSHELIAAAASYEVRVLYIVSHLPIYNNTLSTMHRLRRHTTSIAIVRVSHRVMRRLKKFCKLPPS